MSGGMSGDEFVEFNMHLASELFEVSVPLDFDIGLPLLGLDVDGDIKMMLGFDLDLGIGANKQNGFYLKLNEPEGDPELHVNFEISIPV